MLGTSSRQLGHFGKLREAPPDQSVHQGCARRLPDPQPEERLITETKRQYQVQRK